MANEEQASVADESVIRKIQKLLEMASRTKGNEEEAAVAMGKAQELLAKYNLDLAIVKDAVVEGGVQPAEAKREERKVNRSAQYDWQKTLWKTLADCNFCWHFTMTVSEKDGKNRNGDQKWKRVKRHMIVGTVENATLVHMMGDYLCDTIERLLPFTNNAERLSREAISWRAGCGHRLEERIRKQRWDRVVKSREEKEASGGTGLALIDVEAKEYAKNYDFICGAGSYAKMLAKQAELAKQPSKPETPAEMRQRQKDEERWAKQYEREQERRRHKYNNSAFSAGYKEGGNISLNNQVSHGKNTPVIG